MQLDRAPFQANLGPKNMFLMLRNHGLLTLGSRCVIVLILLLQIVAVVVSRGCLVTLSSLLQHCGRVCSHVLHGHGLQDTSRAPVSLAQPLPPAPTLLPMLVLLLPRRLHVSPCPQLDAQAAAGVAGMRMIEDSVLKDIDAVSGRRRWLRGACG
jgi:hypothetical protein